MIGVATSADPIHFAYFDGYNQDEMLKFLTDHGVLFQTMTSYRNDDIEDRYTSFLVYEVVDSKIIRTTILRAEEYLALVRESDRKIFTTPHKEVFESFFEIQPTEEPS